jgi:hypothetical protein
MPHFFEEEGAETIRPWAGIWLHVFESSMNLLMFESIFKV